MQIEMNPSGNIKEIDRNACFKKGKNYFSFVGVNVIIHFKIIKKQWVFKFWS